jgi:tRNA threonylcarbamoyladenosine biosynthesis protein TsaB
VVTLAVDTSQAVGAAALSRDGVALGEEHFAEPSSHLVELSRAVERLLAAAELRPGDIDRVAVVVGPGSFTGVRIALAFAKGLHAASGAAVVTMASLELLALPNLSERARARVCAMIDAKRGEVYAAVYERARDAGPTTGAVAVVEPRAERPTSFLDSLTEPPSVFVGTGALAYRAAIVARFPSVEIASEERALPSVAWLASIAPMLPPLDRAGVRALEPMYLRPSGAERVRLRPHAPGKERAGDD